MPCGVRVRSRGQPARVPRHIAPGFHMVTIASRSLFHGALAVLLTHAAPVHAQSRELGDSVVARALVVSPRVRMFDAQASAARARIPPAGAWANPMVMVGIQNLALGKGDVAMPGMGAAGPEPMTMKMLGVSQTIPYPGKTSLRTRAARAEAEAAEARATAARREIRRDVLGAYYALAEARMLNAIVERQQQLAAAIVPATEARYVSGTTAQADVLKARNEAAALVQERDSLVEEEHAALARLNALLDQASATTLQGDSLGRDLAPPVSRLSVDSLHAMAQLTNPRLVERRAMVAVQTARAELAQRERLPDFDVSLQYGQRDRLPDMITALVSVPLPIQRGRKQSAEAAAARLDVTAAEAELRADENEIRSDVARLHAALERQRANLDLLDRVILPQARATFSSASTTYQSGRGELLGVLDAMRSLFATETMRVRTIAEYARTLAELEMVTGHEVSP